MNTNVFRSSVQPILTGVTLPIAQPLLFPLDLTLDFIQYLH
ncbi:hypothetical protein PALU110988_26330 [Paenibacillus lupini]|nr:hypothetical protein [Paenibacillus lupini]